MFSVHDFLLYFASHKPFLTLELNLFNMSTERHDERIFPTLEKKTVFGIIHEISES